MTGLPKTIDVDVREGVGLITLNRPSALNAINLEMAQVLLETLKSWQHNDAVHLVVLRSSCLDAFCAGGDVKMIYSLVKEDKFSEAETFYKTEYQVNALLSSYAKPVVAFGHGIVMGGGMGLVMHSHYRLAVGESFWAMPETAIGFFPDVGAINFFNKCPKETGTLMALSGYRANPADALYAGLATHYLDTRSLDVFLTGLFQANTQENAAGVIDILLENFSSDPPQESALSFFSESIDACFSQETLPDILSSLDGLSKTSESLAAQKWFKSIHAALQKNSPLSLVITLAYLRCYGKKSLKDVFEMDANLAEKFIKQGDFMEGVRAKLVDKCARPRWLHQDYQQISPREIEDFLESVL